MTPRWFGSTFAHSLTQSCRGILRHHDENHKRRLSLILAPCSADYDSAVDSFLNAAAINLAKPCMSAFQSTRIKSLFVQALLQHTWVSFQRPRGKPFVEIICSSFLFIGNLWNDNRSFILYLGISHLNTLLLFSVLSWDSDVLAFPSNPIQRYRCYLKLWWCYFCLPFVHLYSKSL